MYIINKTDGTILTEIVDGTIDQVSTDLTLLGKNSSSYGEYWNENFLHMLENFASNITPLHPIVGQLWYDTGENRLKIYDGAAFKVTSSAIVDASAPSSMTQGDLWVNTKTQQLYFNDGISNVLSGPIYTADQGLSGFYIDDIIDTSNKSHTVAKLYVANMLLGIFSKDSFTPASNVDGYTKNLTAVVVTGTTAPTSTTSSLVNAVNTSLLEPGQAIKFADAIGGLSTVTTYYVLTIPSSTTFSISTVDNSTPVVLQNTTSATTASFINASNDIKVGFNVAAVKNFKINATATSAEALVDSLGHVKTADSFISTQFNSTMNGALTIATSTPLYLGVSSQTEIQSTNDLFAIKLKVSNQNANVQVKRGNNDESAIFVNSALRKVQIYPDLSAAVSTLEVNGTVVVKGDLTVEGAMTTVNSTTVAIEDKMIELGSTDTPTDVLADGGGIALKGTTDKTITWSSGNWTSSENFNIGVNKTYKINGVDVLTHNTLSASITNAPGLTNIGSLATLQIGKINLAGNSISYIYASDPDGTIRISPKGAGTVDVTNNRISSVANPADPKDAVNFQTLDKQVKIAPLGLSMDIASLSGTDTAINTQIATRIGYVYPYSEHAEGALCRVFCTAASVITVRTFVLNLSTNLWTWQSTQTL